MKCAIILWGGCLLQCAINTAKWLNELKLKEKQKLLTNANNFLDFDTGGVDLFGKLTDGLVWVLVGKWVNIYPHAWGKKFEKKEGMKQQQKKE